MGGVGSAVLALVGLVGGGDGWHRLMVGGAAGGDLGGVVVGEGLGCDGGAGACGAWQTMGGLSGHSGTALGLLVLWM